MEAMTCGSMPCSGCFDRVLAQAAGPRFVAGDFNLVPEEVPHLALLRQHGFRELQEVARIKFGRMPEFTCRQASQKEFLSQP